MKKKFSFFLTIGHCPLPTLFLSFIVHCSLNSVAQTQLVIQGGLNDGADRIEFSPNGKYLASGSEHTGEIQIWEIESNRMLTVLSGHTDDITDLHYFDKGKKMVSSAGDDFVRIWDVETEKTIQSIEVDAEFIAVTPDDKTIITAGWGLGFYSVATGSRTSFIEFAESGLIGLSCSEDGKYAAVITIENIIIVDLKTKSKIKTIANVTDIQFDEIEFSPDGKYLAASVYDSLLFFQTADWGKHHVLRVSDEFIETFEFSPDNDLIAIGDGDNILFLVDVESGEITNKMEGYSGRDPNDIAFSPDGKMVARCTDLSEIDVYQVSNAQKIVTFKGYTSEVLDMAASADGRFIAVYDYNSSDIHIYDLATGKIKNLIGEYRFVSNLQFNAQGNILYITDDDLHVSTWDVVSGMMINQVAKNIIEESIENFVLDELHNIIYVIDDEGIQYQLDATTLELLNTTKIPFEEAEVSAINIRADGQQAVTSEPWSGKVTVIEPRLFKKLKELSAPTTIQQFNKNEYRGYHLMPHIMWRDDTYINFRQDGMYDYMRDIVYNPACDRCAATGAIATVEWDIATGKVLHVYPEAQITPSVLAYNPDGTMLAVSGDRALFFDGDDTSRYKYPISVWNTQTGKLIFRLFGHTGAVTHLQFTNDNRFIISSSYDGSIRYWDVAEQKEVAAIIPMGTEDLIMFNRDGYYFATRNATNGVAFREDDHVYPFQSFDLKFNRPDLILEQFGYANERLIKAFRDAYYKRLAKMNLTEASLSSGLHLPKIALNADLQSPATENSMINISVQASDSLYKLDRIYVWVNGVPEKEEGFSVREKSIQSFLLDHQIELNFGNNLIKVSCLNDKGVESLHRSISVNYAAPAPLPDCYIVAIGVADYNEDDYDLSFSAKDALDLSEFFESKWRTDLYENIHTLVLTDKQVTRESILATHEFLLQAGVNDRTVVFVSGHGLLNESLDFFYATADVSFANPVDRGLKYEELENLLQNIPCRQRLLLIDACHSGEVDKESVVWNVEPPQDGINEQQFVSKGDKMFFGVENSLDIMQRMFSDLRKGSGITVIAASAGSEFSYELGDISNGVFTYSLINALGDELDFDTDDDGEDGISVQELSRAVARSVQLLTQGKQSPASRQMNVDNNFLIW